MLSSVAPEPESLVVRTDIGDQIHYLDWGGPSAVTDRAVGSPLPPIALIHGLAATAWDWAPVARRLAEYRASSPSICAATACPIRRARATTWSRWRTTR